MIGTRDHKAARFNATLRLMMFEIRAIKKLFTISAALL
jgi:hypothetical protein